MSNRRSAAIFEMVFVLFVFFSISSSIYSFIAATSEETTGIAFKYAPFVDVIVKGVLDVAFLGRPVVRRRRRFDATLHEMVFGLPVD